MTPVELILAGAIIAVELILAGAIIALAIFTAIHASK